MDVEIEGLGSLRGQRRLPKSLPRLPMDFEVSQVTE